MYSNGFTEELLTSKNDEFNYEDMRFSFRINSTEKLNESIYNEEAVMYNASIVICYQSLPDNYSNNVKRAILFESTLRNFIKNIDIDTLRLISNKPVPAGIKNMTTNYDHSEDHSGVLFMTHNLTITIN